MFGLAVVDPKNILKLLVCSFVPSSLHMSEDHEDLKTGIALSDGPVRNPDIVPIRKEREKRGYLLQLLSHTLSRKNLLALTGLFLCFFLVIHLFGNLQLLLPAGGTVAIQFLFQAAFREYPD